MTSLSSLAPSPQQLQERYENLQPLLAEFDTSCLALRKKFAAEATPEAILSGAQNKSMSRLLPLVEAELEVRARGQDFRC